MKKLLSVCAFALLAQSVSAHQFFIKQEANDYKVGFWADDHWGQYQADKIFGVKAYSKDGKAIKNSGFDYQNAKVFASGDVYAMSIMYDFGYYTFTPKGHFSQKRSDITDKEGANEVVQTRKIYKIGKSIFKWDEKVANLGLKFEIVPLQNPLELKVGDKLKVKVLLDGKPISGVEFEDQNDDIDGIATDKNGEATLTLSKPKDGLQIIAAGIKMPNLDKDADTLQLTATLSFKNK